MAQMPASQRSSLAAKLGEGGCVRAKVMSVLFPAPLRYNASYTYPPCARCTAEFAPEHHSVLFLWFLHFTIAGFATLDVHVIDHIFPKLANHLEAPLPKPIWPLTSALDDSHFAHTDHAARPHTHTHTHTHTRRAHARARTVSCGSLSGGNGLQADSMRWSCTRAVAPVHSAASPRPALHPLCP
jgi:hypothetical protein